MDDETFLAFQHHTNRQLARWAQEIKSGGGLSAWQDKFNPNQPRVPAGHRDGGQWTDDGAGRQWTDDDFGGSSTITPTRAPKKPGFFQELLGVRPAWAETLPNNISKRQQLEDAADTLTSRAVTAPNGNCARAVRLALEAHGIKIGIPETREGANAAHARDFGDKLKEAGFIAIIHGKKPAKEPATETLKKGDVTVIQPTSKNKAGHMAMYNGQQWISDYKQPGFWPGNAYRSEKPDYVVYRLPEIE